MDKKYYIANWKSHKTKEDSINFFESFKNKISNIDLSSKEIIIAPPFTLLAKCRYLIDKHNLPIKLAAQNVSPFPQGAYTGEINAVQIYEFAEYVIVGHSERRKYFHESQADIENKVREAHDAGLKIIQCVQDENDKIEDKVLLAAYEPPSAIGSGNPDSPEHISGVFDKIAQSYQETKLLYGGSVDDKNIHEFMSINNLSGFLIGGASLEADSFIALLNG